MNNTRTHQERKPRFVRNIERRYNKACAELRGMNLNADTKNLQMELEWTRRKIETYGFQFQPEHFIYDDVSYFEKIVAELNNHPSTKFYKNSR